MRNYKSHVASIAFVSIVIGAGLTACGSSADGESSRAQDEAVQGDGRYKWWRQERADRQAAFDEYLAVNSDQFKSFKNAPLGNLGIPMIMLRLFPEIFPDVWGAPSDHFAPVGLHQDTYEPTRVLPLGLGFIGSEPAVPTPYGNVNVNVVALTCMGCHGGTVQGADGSVTTIPGAPNTQFDGFRGAVYRTVTDARYTADGFRAALAAKPLGWVYGDPALGQQEAVERGIFMAPGAAEQFLAKLRAGSLAGGQRFAQTLGAYTYQVPNAPNPYGSTPGYLDAIGAGIAILVNPATLTPDQVKAALPPLPAMIDIMSVWRQSDRPAAQWDGSIISPIHRNLGAEFGVIGDPSHLNMKNVELTTPFTQDLPAPPYPFDVERAAAKRGERLFGRYCASCHAPGNATIFPTSYVGTDANRASIWTPVSIAGLQGALRASCTNPAVCNKPDASAVPNEEITRSTGGYMALPLDGIWARAPYLHNGAVPTLAALLTKNRPATFWRGNTTYDTQNVGFAWASQVSPRAALYDTSKSGNTNVGHDTAEFLGDVDWANEPRKLFDMLEYLKTL